MSHRREAPENHGNSITNPRAHTVNQAAHKNHADRIGRLKREYQVSVVDVVPAQVVLKRAFQNAEHLPVHIVFGYAQKQEAADHPAEAPGEYATFLRASKRSR